MRHEEASLDPLEQKLAEWARREPAVGAALLIGSRASPEGPRDRLSDHDVVLFLQSGSRLQDRDDWLETFGRPLMVFKDTAEHRSEPVPTRLVQYRGGHRIDFTLSRMDLLHRIAEQESLPDWLAAGYRVLFDSEHVAERLHPPSAMAYVPRPPRESEYRKVVEEFWWESLYVAKFVGRNELLPARYSLETVLRFRCLVPMLEWYVQVARQWEQNVGVHGSGLRWLLEPDERELLDATYAGDTLQSHAHALQAMIDLFGRAARTVARDLGFHYPGTIEHETRKLLEQR